MLGLAGAREVTADEEPMLHNIVEEMAIAAGLPKPKIAVIETDVPNAFATGMDPKNAAIGVTRGLLQKLNRDELQGVIGHEMGHVLNMDTRYMTAVAILVGLIALVCDVARRMMWYGAASGGGRRRDRDKGGGNAILLVIFIVFAILAPIAAQLVRFAVSRQREYLADATSVRLTRNPVGLIGALEKLAAEQRPFDGANRATQHMFIVNPFKVFGANSTALFSTHPPLEARIERLSNLGGRSRVERAGGRTVVAGWMIATWASSPRRCDARRRAGTTNISPASSSTSRSRSCTVSRPPRHQNSSSSCSWECQTKPPLNFPIFTACR